MNKYLCLIVISLFLITGCTKNKELRIGECQELNVSTLSFSTDVIKIKCKDTIYRCFIVNTGYGAGVDCFEVQDD